MARKTKKKLSGTLVGEPGKKKRMLVKTPVSRMDEILRAAWQDKKRTLDGNSVVSFSEFLEHLNKLAEDLEGKDVIVQDDGDWDYQYIGIYEISDEPLDHWKERKGMIKEKEDKEKEKRKQEYLKLKEEFDKEQ